MESVQMYPGSSIPRLYSTEHMYSVGPNEPLVLPEMDTYFHSCPN